MFKLIHSSIEYVKNYSASRVEVFGAQYMPFGIFGVINYPLYYLIWVYLADQSYENLFLRCTATIICAPLIFHNYWPEKLKSWLPFYWHLVLLFCLPYFFTLMLLKNHAAIVWLMSTTVVLVWLSYLVDWAMFIILLVSGISLAYISYTLTTPSQTTLSGNYLLGLIAQYAGALAVVAIFSNNKQKIVREKIATLTAFGGMIAHEMRTPLASLSMIGSVLKRWMTPLLETYEIASQHELEIPYIDKHIREDLPRTAASVQSEVAQAQQIIDMLLAKINPAKLKSAGLKNCHLVEMVQEALTRYAFEEGERELIEFNPSVDFEFKGNDFFYHLIFNLIKNALYQIKATGRGKITLWAESGEPFNTLHFKDTAKGMSKRALSRLFTRFNSDTQHGTGLGLSFCKMLMESYGGRIHCVSQEGEYAEFILQFPKL